MLPLFESPMPLEGNGARVKSDMSVIGGRMMGFLLVDASVARAVAVVAAG
jgi:hypothetical protein